jgi:hypothetical protein
MSSLRYWLADNFTRGQYQAPRTPWRHKPLVPAAALTAAVAMGAFFMPTAASARPMAAGAYTIPPAIYVHHGQPAAASTARLLAGVRTRALSYNVAAATALTYRVHAGDSLSVIARREYGHASQWPALWWINRHAIANPAALPAGLVLKLSPKPVVTAHLAALAVAAIPKPKPAPAAAPAAVPVSSQAPAPAPQPAPQPVAGIYSYSALEALWVSAGGPAGVEATMATIAECESGGNPNAYNPSGASGIWQILGQVVPGNIFDPMVNAENAVAKYNAAGGTSPWVCQ